MNAARRLAALSALLALAAGAAQGQTIRFRMLDHSQTGWRSSGFSSVTCDANGGFLRRASHTTSWVFNNSGAGAFGKNAALQGALQTWTNVTDADFVLTLSGISSAPGFKQSDGVNSFSWGTDGFCDASSCHAIGGVRIHRVKRADGSGATVGDGNHAFVFTTPATLQDHQPHTLRVRYSGNQANLAPPFNLTCP